MRTARYILAGVISLVVVIAAVLALIPSRWFEPVEEEAGPFDFSRPAVVMAEKMLGLADHQIPDASERYRPIPPDEKLFVVSRNLRPVVDFWKRIYTGIYSFQGVLHDSHDVSTVYAIVDLRNEPAYDRTSGASVSEAARKVHRRYKQHLEFLLSGGFDPAKLRGERRQLYNYIISHGGLEEFRNAADRLRVQRGLRDTFKAGLIRSGRYLEHYRTIFRSHGLPEELTLLPHLESSYQFNARSHAAAVGIWQLTKGASERLININNSVDERIDPWRSAEAAARILKYNYNKLKSWPLAITAYNQGAYGMARAVRVVGTRDIDEIIKKYRGRSYGFAGRNFYCAYVAVLEVVHEYEKYFGAVELEQPMPFKQHKLNKSARLHDVAKELGVDKDTLAELNPHLRHRGITSKAALPRGTALNLPEDHTVE